MKTSQTDLLYNLLKDGQPHRTDEIMTIVYGGDHLGLARVGARIYDVKKKYNVEIPDAWPDKEKPTLYWYQIVNKLEPLETRMTTFVTEYTKAKPEITFTRTYLLNIAVQNGYQPLEVSSVLDTLAQRFPDKIMDF